MIHQMTFSWHTGSFFFINCFELYFLFSYFLVCRKVKDAGGHLVLVQTGGNFLRIDYLFELYHSGLSGVPCECVRERNQCPAKQSLRPVTFALLSDIAI